MEDLAYKKTEERERILEELKALELRAVALAESTANPQTQRRVRNVAQSAAAQRSLLIQDYHFEDAGLAA